MPPVREADPGGRFPFDIEYQKALFRLLLEDEGFGASIGSKVQPSYFENQPLAWGWGFSQRYMDQYGSYPGFGVILHQIKTAILPFYRIEVSGDSAGRTIRKGPVFP